MKNSILLSALVLVTVISSSFVRIDDWVTFEGKGCTMLFPKTPTDQTEVINTAIGEVKLFNHMYEVPGNVEDDNLVYGLSETEFSDTVRVNSAGSKEVVDKFFRGSVDGATNSVHGKLITEEVIQLDGYPGRKFRVDVKDGIAVMTMKAILVKNKLYMIQTITETKKDFNKSIGKFMDSFKLKK